MREAFENPVVIASVGRQLSAMLRDSLVDLNWLVIHRAEPVATLRAIRTARAKVAVIEIFAGTNAGCELIRLLSGPPHESSVVAVCGVHSEAIERSARAVGASCYVPFTTDVTPIVQAVSGMLNKSNSVSIHRATAQMIGPVRQISSFPPPAVITRDGCEPARRLYDGMGRANAK